ERDAGRDAARHAIELDRHVGAHAEARAGMARSGAKAEGSMGAGSPRIPATTRSAVAGASVIPSPSCPVATQVRSIAGHAPIRGSASGVAGRNPVQLRTARIPARD